MNLDEAQKEMLRLSGLIDRGVEALRSSAERYAGAERDYRRAKAEAWLTAPRERDGVKLTVPEREAWVQGQTAGLREERDIAEGLRQAALEAVRSRRTQLSAWQSWLAADRTEAELARTGPR